jgi:hypothetical protein
MSEWNFMDYSSKDNLLRVLHDEAGGLVALASEPRTWEAPTAAGHWQVRDVVGHLVDTTEGYFTSFDAARGTGPAPEPLGVRGMDKHVDAGAQAFRGTSQGELVGRLQNDFAKMIEMFDALTEDEWGGLQVPHGYMGPLPAFFYPIFHNCGPDTEPFEIGVRVTGRNGGDTKLRAGPDGVTFEPADIGACPAILEFDPGTLILTAYQRMNAGTSRGDPAVIDRFRNLFFKI